MFVCKICGSEVKQGQAFCQTCGADVVENYETICPTCKTKNGAGSRYCAKCGGILQVMRKPVCVVCGAKNLPGALFCVSCGAPLSIEKETHAEEEMLDARKMKQRLDSMEKERMLAMDNEIAEMKAKANEDIILAKQEVDQYRLKVQEDLDNRSNLLDAYRTKLNELGSEDVALLKKMSTALKNYSAYYADPYSQIDEDDIEGDTYVCPVCGTINPLDAVNCTHCGRNKARALLLLAKGRIKQSPPVKRKQDIIAAPEQDFSFRKVPTIDEFEKGLYRQPEEEKKENKKDDKNQQPANFSGPQNPYYPYPPQYPPYPQGGMPPQGMPPMPGMPPQPPMGYYMGPNGYQMTPIVQPVAFVPYVTQEQPLMQYSPVIDQPKPKPVQKPVQPVEQVQTKKKRK